MQHAIAHGPSFAWLTVDLEPGETVTAEAGAMVTVDPTVDMKTRLNSPTKAGFFGKIVAFFVAIIRKVIGGETMFINDFTADGSGGQLRLAPALAGYIVHRRLENERLLLTAGSYLASGSGLSMRLRFGGLKALLSREGAFFVEISGTGDLWMNAYGGITEVPIDGSFIVDNGHIVAFDAGLDFSIKNAGSGLMGFVASGEGLVCEFQGKGTLWLQSRNTSALVGWISRLLP